MNTATIVQSRTSYDSPIRQTVVIHDPNGDPIVYTRHKGAGQGVHTAWLFDIPTFESGEMLVGTPLTLPLTDLNIAQVKAGERPQSLIQSLERRARVETVMTATPVEPVFDSVYAGSSTLDTNIAHEALHTAEPIVVAPPVPEVVIPAPPVVQPVRQPDAEVPELSYAYSTLIYPLASDPEIAGYIPRTIAGAHEDAFFDKALRKGENVWLGGHAGTGKTTSARRQASRRGVPLAVVNCDPSMDESQVQGELTPTAEGHFVFRNSALVDAIQQPSVVLINEATRMSPKANAYFMSFLMERELRMTRDKGQVIKVHPECLIIADGNWGYKGVAQPDEAFLDRYGVKVEFTYDRDIESKFIPSKALLDVAFAIRDQYELGEYRSVFSTRVLKDFVSNTELGWEFARHSLLNSMKPEDRGGIANTLDLNGSNICDELGIAFPVEA
jgi:hypothetical protein